MRTFLECMPSRMSSIKDTVGPSKGKAAITEVEACRDWSALTVFTTPSAFATAAPADVNSACGDISGRVREQMRARIEAWRVGCLRFCYQFIEYQYTRPRVATHWYASPEPRGVLTFMASLGYSLRGTYPMRWV